METKLVATYVAEDALSNLTGRLTLYNLFGERYAATWPAVAGRMVVATTWLREAEERQHAQRVLILAPDGDLVAEAATSFAVGGGRPIHTQVVRFDRVVLPAPGTYRVQVWLDRTPVADLPLVAVDTGEQEQANAPGERLAEVRP